MTFASDDEAPVLESWVMEYLFIVITPRSTQSEVGRAC